MNERRKGGLTVMFALAAVCTAGEAAPRSLSKAELDEVYPRRNELAPRHLEQLAILAAKCGGPWERQFLNEPKALAGAKYVHRKGDRLVVGGIVFKNGNGEIAPGFEYMGSYRGSGIDLVHVQYYEGDGYILVDRKSKTKVEFGRIPVPSPTGRFFAGASDADAYNFHGVQIAELTPKGLRIVVEDDERKVQYPCGLRWLTDGRIELQALRHGFEFKEGECCSWTRQTASHWGKAGYTLSSGRWVYEAPK